MGIKGPTDNSDRMKCPFRVIRTSSNKGDTRGEVWEMICEASGGEILEALEKIPIACLSCDIPAALTEKYACLYLIPFRVFENDGVQSFYACRWFLTLNPQRIPKNTIWCRGCRYWFPRPDESLIPNKARLSHKALQLFLTPPKREISLRSADTKEDQKDRWYKRIWNALGGLWLGYRLGK